MDQSVKERLQLGKTRNVKTGRGVKQGYYLTPILFHIHSEYLTNETLERFENFKIGGEAIRTVKYTDELVLVAKEQDSIRFETKQLYVMPTQCICCV